VSVTLPELHAVKQAAEAIRAGRAAEIVGPWGSAKSILACQAAAALGVSLLYVTTGRVESEGVLEDLLTFCGPDSAALLPAWEVLPTDIMAPADDIVAERMNTLERLATRPKDAPPIHTVVPVRSLLQCVANRDHLLRDTLALEVGQEYELEALLLDLIKMGYNRELMVEARGEISVRGGILDIFPISGELPYRVEFFGDEVESIRRFEPETQRSIDKASQIHILPRSERGLLAQQAATAAPRGFIADYLPPGTLVVLDEPMAVKEEADKLADQFQDSPFFVTWHEAETRLAPFHSLTLAQVGYAKKDRATRVTAPMRSMAGWGGNPEGFWDQLKQWDLDRYTVYLLCNNPGERQRLFELLEEHGYHVGHDTFALHVELGRMRAGFASEHDKLAVLSEREMFGRRYVRRMRRRFEAGAAITAFSDLKSGDYVVHAEHGIGRYLGLRRFEGKAGDFLTIQYAAGDKIYVPVTHIDLVTRYSAGDGAIPKIDKIGGKTWERAKGRVKKAVKDMTDELVKLYAAREATEGHAFTPDTPWQREFEDAFEYDETPDQARAIVDVKADMESPRPMDRLICGDVGYGKTEVAMRAAFKCVMDGMQTAVLVPTTVLAQQHFSTFTERMADYPVKIDMLSRFRSPKELKSTIERLKSGEVDIVIGTHRLVSKDVQFKNLGLVVIDEEQRFGVAQKERLKQLRTHVDVITMSATPIPRTLNMSLLGVRDMSIINTAPNDRLPIHTCIEAWDENLIREAIVRELAREGQVFFLHNRVQTIEQVAEFVKKIVPGARVEAGHGQMHEHELEHVMSRFINKECDVLVCTTIIGSGVDIPNANTIIVDHADYFGLSQLYQIRGRVGRYKHRAFAYLLVPGDRALTEEAQKRLKALEEFSTLGSGFRIAMRDMEIRGAGNVLGGEQHGHIVSVGYDTYVQLVEEAVAEVKGEPIRRRALPPFDIAVDAFIPEEYVPSEAQKITLYKRIAGLQSVEEVREMQAELNDRFGAPPAPVKRLLDVVRVRALGAEIGARSLAGSKEAVIVQFDSGTFLTRKARGGLEKFLGDGLEFSWQDKPAVRLALSNGENPVQAAERLLGAMVELEQ
jgi:transcription-repair coupling factor (superfamily II helicase)